LHAYELLCLLTETILLLGESPTSINILGQAILNYQLRPGDFSSAQSEKLNAFYDGAKEAAGSSNYRKT